MSINVTIVFCVLAGYFAGAIINTLIPAKPKLLQPVLAGIINATIVLIALVSINH